MKINFTWDIARDTNEIEIIANPVNKRKIMDTERRTKLKQHHKCSESEEQ